jgi:hypothetical protein
MEKGALVRDCREIGRTKVTCKVGIVDSSVRVECGIHRENGEKGRGIKGR